jgi:hypothetical protein
MAFVRVQEPELPPNAQVPATIEHEPIHENGKVT